MDADEDDESVIELLRQIRSALAFIAFWSMATAVLLALFVFGLVVVDLRPA